MNIAYHYEAKNLHFLNRPKNRKVKNNNLRHILAIILLLENEKISQVVPFLIAGHISSHDIVHTNNYYCKLLEEEWGVGGR